MHSPRIAPKKKTLVAQQQQQHLSLHTDAVSPPRLAPPASQRPDMSSDALYGLLGKYHEQTKHFAVSEDWTAEQQKLSAQEIARIALAVAPKKPELKEPDPYQNVSSRVFDFMKGVVPPQPLGGQQQQPPPPPTVDVPWGGDSGTAATLDARRKPGSLAPLEHGATSSSPPRPPQDDSHAANAYHRYPTLMHGVKHSTKKLSFEKNVAGDATATSVSGITTAGGAAAPPLLLAVLPQQHGPVVKRSPSYAATARLNPDPSLATGAALQNRLGSPDAADRFRVAGPGRGTYPATGGQNETLVPTASPRDLLFHAGANAPMLQYAPGQQIKVEIGSTRKELVLIPTSVLGNAPAAVSAGASKSGVAIVSSPGLQDINPSGVRMNSGPSAATTAVTDDTYDSQTTAQLLREIDSSTNAEGGLSDGGTGRPRQAGDDDEEVDGGAAGDAEADTSGRRSHPTATSKKPKLPRSYLPKPDKDARQGSPLTDEELAHRQQRYSKIVTDTHPIHQEEVFNTHTRTALARLRNQIALLCQQASVLAASQLPPDETTTATAGRPAAGSKPTNAQRSAAPAPPPPPPHFEVQILERGQVTWRSTEEDAGPLASPDTAPLGAGGGDGAGADGDNNPDERWLLSDDPGDVSMEIDAVKRRARRTYNKALAAFKAKITQQKDTIAKLKSQLETNLPGGVKYQQLEEDLEIVREECRKQMGKIKTLVNLLDRAGQTIRFHEDQRSAEAMGNAMRKEHAAPWAQARRVIPTLDAEPPRTDAQIFADILRFMEAQEEKLRAHSTHIDQLTTQLEDAQVRYDALQKVHKTAQRELEQCKYELETVRQRIKYEQEERSNALRQQQQQQTSSFDSSSGGGKNGSTPVAIRSPSQPFAQSDADRMRLVDKICALEAALKSSTEVKGFFQTLGVGPEVHGFLRIEGPTIRNVNLPKIAVENMICGIWLTRFLPSVAHSKPLQDAKWLVREGEGPPDFSRGTVVVKSLERMFILAVQAVFSSIGIAVADASVLSPVQPDLTAPVQELGPPTTLLSFDSVPSGGDSRDSEFIPPPPEVDPNRHPATDFTDDNNIAMWQVKRSEAKRMVHFSDHITRFLLECIEPAACKTCLTLYTVGSGITTPPIATMQVQRRGELFLQAPQFPSLVRPGMCMPTAVAEVAYSLMDGCERFSFDGDVHMFKRIVKGDIPEAAYYDMMLMIEKLRVATMNSHTLYQAPYRWPVPTVATVLHMLKRFFPKKSPAAMAQLQRSLLMDMKETTINSDSGSVMRLMRKASVATTQPPAQGAAGDGTGSPNQRSAASAVHPFDLPMDDDTPLSAMDIEARREALRTPVDVAKLFSATESGNQGHFLDALKAQYLTELTRFGEEVRQRILTVTDVAPPTLPTGVAAIDDAPVTTIEKSKKRRSVVANYFQLQQQQEQEAAAAAQAAAAASQNSPLLRGPNKVFDSSGGRQATLRAVADHLQGVDPPKPMAEIETYLFHLVQILLLSKMRSGAALAPIESEMLTMSREEIWKRGPNKVALWTAPLDDFAKFSSMVLFRRTAPEY